MKKPEAPKKEAPEDVKEEPVLEPKSAPGEESPAEKQEPKTITIPGPRTESGKDETREVTADKPTSLHSALVEVTATEQAPEYKTLDLGDAGTLEIENVATPHNGLSGLEYGVQIRVSDTETFVIQNVPARYLK